MMAPGTPIETCAAERAATLRQSLRIEPDIPAESLALLGELQIASDEAQQALALQAVKYEHTQFSCKMVIAYARLAQSRLTRARANAHRAGTERDAHEVLEKLRHVAVGEAKVPMPPLIFDRDQARSKQFREMRTDRLLGHRRRLGKLGGGQGLARHQRGQNASPRAVADERRDAHDVRVVFHGSIQIEPSW